ncbi:Mitogen-activated protein kinase kinase kinase [Salix suchowensis]|nr:Mitogen-activated protein kinase kinase kinase [Salix suchowensis]
MDRNLGKGMIDQQKNYEQIQSNNMDARNEGKGSVNQRYFHDPSATINTNMRPPDYNMSMGARPVQNYSIQTGEEFALEFMRERVNPRQQFFPNTNIDPNSSTSYVELKKAVLGIPHMGSESGADISMISSVEKARNLEFDRKGSSVNEDQSYYDPVLSVPRTSSRNDSSRGIHSYTSSGASDSSSTKLKFLCSFGGTILPRPSDGKLRYVGGETRIIRISKNISWQELMQKTVAIYSQSHTIKYQLPGEDLDALVSVSCDEDLQNMMEECNVSGDGGSEKPRMFLFSSNDLEDSQFGIGSGEGENSEIQYVVAVNGMDLGSRKNSMNLASVSGNNLDELLSLNVVRESGQVAADFTGSNVLSSAVNMLPSTIQSSQPVSVISSIAQESSSQPYRDQKMDRGDNSQRPASSMQPIESFSQVVDGRGVNPLPIPIQYGFVSHLPNHAIVGENLVGMPFHVYPPNQQGVLAEEKPYGGFHVQNAEVSVKDAKLKRDSSGKKINEPEKVKSMDKEAAIKELKMKRDNSSQKLNETVKIQAVENDTVSLHPHDSCVPNYTSREEVLVANSMQEVGSPLRLMKSNKSAQEAVLNSMSTETVTGGIENNRDDHFHSSGDPFAPGYGGFEVDSTDFSYPELSVVSHRVFHSERIPREQAELNRLSKSDDSFDPQILITQARSGYHPVIESIDKLHEGNVVSHTDQSRTSERSRYANPQTIEDGLAQFEKYKEFADNISKVNPNIAQGLGSNVQKSESRRVVFNPVDDYEGSQVKGNYTDRSINDNKAVGLTYSSTSHGTSSKHPEDPALGPQEFERTDIGADNNKGNNTKVSMQPLAWTESPVRAVSQGEPTIGVGTPGQKDIRIDINDRFPPDFLSDIFSQVKIHETGLGPQEFERTIIAADINNGNNSKVSVQPLAWTRNPVKSVSQGEASIGVGTPEQKDIYIDINDRFPPDFLSDIFSKAKIHETGDGLMYGDEVGLSLNVENHDPQRRSYFQNLAQDQSARKVFSLIDQDQVSYSSSLANVEGGAPVDYSYPPLKSDGVGLPHIEEDVQQETSGVVGPNTMDSNADYGRFELKGTESAQLDGVNARIPESEYEGGKLDIQNTPTPLVDLSLGEFDISTLQIIKNEDLEELRELGSGTFGTVYHGKWRGTDVAIKRIKKSCFTGRSSEQERLTTEFWREAEILSKLHHPNVVAFYGVVQDGPGGTLATVTEFMVNGSLRHVLLSKDRHLDRRKRLIIAMDAAFGMEYLHSKNIVHFDLKCDNLLVNLKDPLRPICKVGDFGLSKIKRNTLVTGGVRGTLPWMAPELLNGSSSKVSEKVDVFSFAIVLWEILTGEEPYANMHYGAIIGGIVNNTLRPPVPSFCDQEWRLLMEQCWAPDPMARPSFTEITRRLRVMSAACQTKQIAK